MLRPCDKWKFVNKIKQSALVNALFIPPGKATLQGRAAVTQSSCLCSIFNKKKTSFRGKTGKGLLLYIDLQKANIWKENNVLRFYFFNGSLRVVF